MSVNHHWKLDMFLMGRSVVYCTVLSKEEKQNIFAVMSCVYDLHNGATYPCAASAWPWDERQLKTASFDHCVDCFLFTI